MRVSFLGTGAAGGVPLYGCDCPACARARACSDFRRRPCSALVEAGDTRVLLDAGLTDLAERITPGTLAAIVLTHFHADHVQGLLHLRWGCGPRIAVYGPPDAEGCADLFRHPGLLEFRPLAAFEPLVLGPLTLTPLPLIHSKPTFGYAIGSAGGARFAYLTDAAGLPPESEAFLRAWRPAGIALDCSHPPREAAPRNHNDWTRALAVIAAVAPERAWLTHVGHELDHWLLDARPALPPGTAVAADGLAVSFPDPAPTPSS
jgi:phosphoribosyl 1,2-cyclic phosphate phosphodiesterase